jgi:hypothetical protein
MVLKGSRMPVAAIFENLEAGANIGFLEFVDCCCGSLQNHKCSLDRKFSR